MIPTVLYNVPISDRQNDADLNGIAIPPSFLTDEKFVDINKLNKRQSEMLDNINKSMIGEGNILIITGCGHLEFFRKNLKSALFPLDN